MQRILQMQFAAKTWAMYYKKHPIIVNFYTTQSSALYTLSVHQ